MRGRANIEIGMYYDVQSRRFYTNKVEFNHQYAWDTAQYTDEIPYPDKSDASEDEVFGKEKEV